MTRSITQELPNILLLIVLYTIQGVPNGLVFGSIPFLLQQHTSYTSIGIFSLAQYPYSLKLLWSPIVDAIFFKKVGRRKSWIIPIQLITGALLLLTSTFAETLFSPKEGEDIPVGFITLLFFSLIMLTATQDIAVDGWALTMLSKENVGYASTCQTIGLSSGFMLSYTVFLALNSPEFCNRYLRSAESVQAKGLVSLSGYLQFWGVMFLVVTAVIALFKREEEAEQEQQNLEISAIYKQIWSILHLPNMKSLVMILLTYKLGFAIADGVTPMKFVEKGFRKDNMALIVTLSFPFEFVFAIVAGRLASKNSIFAPWKAGFTLRLFIALFGALLVYVFPSSSGSDQAVPFYFYAIIMVMVLLYSLCSNFMFVSICGFFASIADPAIGGTYLTLLNTFNNFGGTWPKFFIFWFIDMFTWKECKLVNENESGGDIISTATVCTTTFDGYYVMAIGCVIMGAFMLYKYLPKLETLQRLDKDAWKVGTVTHKKEQK